MAFNVFRALQPSPPPQKEVAVFVFLSDAPENIHINEFLDQ